MEKNNYAWHHVYIYLRNNFSNRSRLEPTRRSLLLLQRIKEMDPRDVGPATAKIDSEKRRFLAAKRNSRRRNYISNGLRSQSTGTETRPVVAVCRPMGPDRNAIAMQANPSAPFVHPLARPPVPGNDNHYGEWLQRRVRQRASRYWGMETTL